MIMPLPTHTHTHTQTGQYHCEQYPHQQYPGQPQEPKPHSVQVRECLHLDWLRGGRDWLDSSQLPEEQPHCFQGECVVLEQNLFVYLVSFSLCYWYLL